MYVQKYQHGHPKKSSIGVYRGPSLKIEIVTY